MKKLQLTFTLIAFALLSGKAQTLTTIAGNGTPGYFGDNGPAISALLDHPNQLAFDQAGNMYIAEDYNNIIRKIDVFGTITTVAGNGTQGFSGDGFPAVNAQLNRVTGVAVDVIGNIYICDADNNRIRKVDTAGIIHTIAGKGTVGYSGDNGPADSAEFGFNSGICVDAIGNIYIATQNNGNCIRKIDTAGTITTLAGTGVTGYNGDGIAATTAQLGAPASVFIDGAGNLYIGDLGGFRVRKVNTLGIISTVAGNGNSASGGDGGLATSAQLFYPYGVALDAIGNLYICESGYNRIRKVDTTGHISTLAGVPGLVGGYGGDNGPLLSAQFYHPSAVSLDAAGNIYIGDYENSAIRKISSISTSIQSAKNNNLENVQLFPNPATDKVNIMLHQWSTFSLKLSDIAGKTVVTKNNLSGNSFTLDISEYANGMYLLEITTLQTVTKVKLVK